MWMSSWKNIMFTAADVGQLNARKKIKNFSKLQRVM